MEHGGRVLGRHITGLCRSSGRETRRIHVARQCSLGRGRCARHGYTRPVADHDAQPAPGRRMSRRPRPEGAPLETVSYVLGLAGDIEVVTQGTGRPIVIVHGGTGNRTSWEGVADHLAASFSVLRYTRPTYRLTPPARGAAAVQIELAEARAVAASAREPVVLVGHSSGAAVAIEAALADPS